MRLQITHALRARLSGCIALNVLLTACADTDPFDATTTTSGSTAGTPTSSTTTSSTTTSATSATTSTPDPTWGPFPATGSGVGQCGWDAELDAFRCSGEPSAIDPENIHTFECPPEPPRAGAPCDESGPITSIGCCDFEDNYYCGPDGVVVVERCLP